MATINEIGNAANQAAQKAEEAAAKIAEAQAKAEEIKAKAAEIKRKKEEAQRKVKEIKEKVKKLKIKKEKVDKKIALFQMPKGIGYIILSFLIRTLQQTWVAEKAIALLKKKFEEKCPLPEVLKKIIKNKNRVGNVITQIQQIIQTLQTTTQTLNTLTQALSAIVLAAEGLIMTVGMFPTTPPATTTIAADQKLTAKEKIQKVTTTVAQGVAGLTVINFALIKLTTLLQEIEALISVCLIEAIENGEMSEDEVNELLIDLNTKSTDSSNEEDDKAKGEALLSQFPIHYRGFRLEMQQDPNNPLETIPRRRVIGTQVETEILGIATDFSFSATTEVLVNEAKFLVDQWIFNTTEFESNIVIPIIETQEEIPEPDTSAIDEANAAAEAAIAAANQATAAAAEQARQAQIKIYQDQISEWNNTIIKIKAKLDTSIGGVNFNKKNKAEWKGRVNSWLPQQWLGKKALSAYNRISRKFGNKHELGGDLTGALNNWFSLNKKIKINETKISNL